MEIKLKGLWLEACAPSLIMKQNWKIEENEMETKFKLVVKNSGSYTADSFLELIWIVFKHRCQHLLKGDGFID